MKLDAGDFPTQWTIDNPLNVQLIDASGYQTGQGYHDEDHLTQITHSMQTEGWQGAPLVVLSNYGLAYSGSHRLAAAEAAELDVVPGVELADLFAAAGLDLNELLDEHDLGCVTDRGEIAELLPEDIRTAYGIGDLDHLA